MPPGGRLFRRRRDALDPPTTRSAALSDQPLAAPEFPANCPAHRPPGRKRLVLVRKPHGKATDVSSTAVQAAPVAQPMLGYIRTNLVTTAAELLATKDQLAAFAGHRGFRLSGVYFERPESAPAAFHALIEAIRRDNVRLVVVPDLNHLGGTGASLREHLEHYTRALVLVARPL